MKTDRGRWVDLTPEETWIGAMIGVMRQRRGIMLGKNHREGFKGDPWENHIEGACGEMAAYKSINHYWCPSITKEKEEGGDGGPYEVRRRKEDWYDLNLRPGDSLDRPYILVIGSLPRFRVVGWAWGYDIKQDRYRKPDVGEGWFMPQEDVTDLEHLPVL